MRIGLILLITAGAVLLVGCGDEPAEPTGPDASATGQVAPTTGPATRPVEDTGARVTGGVFETPTTAPSPPP